MARKSALPVEARMTAVLAALRGEESVEVIARRHGVSSHTLLRWKQEFLEGGKTALRGRDGRPSAVEQALRAEIEQRDRIIGELVVANELLKKTPASR